MQIQSSAVQLQSKVQQRWTQTLSERLSVRVDPAPTPTVIVEDSLRALAEARPEVAPTEADPEADGELSGDAELTLLKLVLEKLLKVQLKLRPFHPEEVEGSAAPTQRPAGAPEPGQRPPERVGWSISWDRLETLTEEQALSLRGKGVVQLKDGRTVQFALEVEASSLVHKELRQSLRLGDPPKDPLALSLSGQSPALDGGTIRFDLDLDGTLDDMPTLGAGAAWLVADHNADGVVNDGSELFGPATDDGFGELAAQDEDKNGWIDEQDAIWSKLRVWMTDGGAQRLVAVGEAGVGALFVGRVETPFALRGADDPNGEVRGTVRQSGLYLTEGGDARLMQRIDLAV